MGLRRAYRKWKIRQSQRDASKPPAPAPQSLPDRRQAIYLGNQTLLTETFFGRKIYLDASDVSLTPHIIWDGRWEPWVTSFFQREIKPGHVFVDIGANCGFFSVLAADLVGPDGAVIALEPQARLARLVRNSMHVNGFDRFARCIPVAVGEKAETARLAKSDFLSGSASLVGLRYSEDSSETVTVEPLTQILEQAEHLLQRALPPDVIKIDAEGYEWMIWNGARDLFARCPRLVICMEFSPMRYLELEQSPIAFLQAIMADGFSISRLDQKSREHPVSESEMETIADPSGQTDLILRKAS